ncbi:MAG: FmdB family zinc ribbon protein [Chloroflexota bacterium]
MPFYDYLCQQCRRPARLFFRYADYGRSTPACPHCDSTNMKRQIGRIAVAKSEDTRLEGLADDSMLAGLDENDPRSMGRMMKKMSREMGEDLGDDFNEVVDRLEKGESPEKIEKEMPNLTSDA